MRFGQASDSKFVLRATWVNSKWRETLTQSCPSLWNKVCFDGVAKGNTKLFDEYARACIKRSRGNLDIAVLRNFSIGSLNRLWMTLQTLPWTAKTLGVEFTGSQVLESFSTLFRPNMANLRHLLIRCDSIRARTPPKLLTCTDLVSPDKLETLGLDGVYFRTLNVERTITASELKSFRDDIIQYPRLKSLTVHRCAFDGSYAPSLLGDSREYQVDQLHRALRGALGIEFLEVTEPVVGVRMAQPGVGKRITLLQVRELVVPPPSIWSIDILAPHLESLSFASARKSRIEWCLQVARKKHSALIPTIAEAPITLDTLPRLKQVEFFCYEYDQISRLEEWLSQLPNITKLVIIAGKAGNPWPRQANGGSFDYRARMQVLQLLIDHPEWCPELEDLELHACFASGRKLVEFVRNRTKATNCASLRRLALKESLALSAEAFLTLCNEVPEFSHSSHEEPGGSEVARRRRECQQEQYMLDDFEFEPCEILDDQSPCMAYHQVPWITDDQVPWLTDDLVMTLDDQTSMPDLLGADNIVEAFKLQKQYEIGRLPDGETTRYVSCQSRLDTVDAENAIYSGSTARSNCHSEETWNDAIKAKPKTSDSD
ncbi:hypothetical protein QFC21_006524 [Naganishia friedmannii]|uniref:Uncharacterized protein n=1 Tax=Naganishia friedmannii TaxID=89922 RepID=A0ACC2V2H7_9TREE|nr:hypothetical protein QFC21_006524 [Naganishia friedmannii]